MKFEITSSGAAALVALIAGAEAAQHGHHHHQHHHEVRSVPEVGTTLVKKSGQCQFPTDAGLVAITPSEENAGWAMSPNQPCTPGSYCPYACPAGQVSMQWDPEATSYTYPLSMNGGLYCNENGEIEKPFPSRPYCEDGTGAVSVINKAGAPVAFCQTVLPGNEAMLIPTLVEDVATLAVPGESYWCGTAAQYYVNAPGVPAEIGCVWGTSSNPIGNWSPYTVGANTVADGSTYVKLGWNPIYLQPSTPFRSVMPDWGISIECEGDGCNGIPCSIDPSVITTVNDMLGDAVTGAGGATGCTVYVPAGSKANFIVHRKGDDAGPLPSSSADPVETPTPTPTSTETPTETATSASTDESNSSSTTTSMYSNFSSIGAPMPSQSMTMEYKPHVLQPTGPAQITPAGSSSGSDSSSTAASPSATGNSAASATISKLSLGLGAVVAGVFMNL
ncbi:hypothetical protein N7510_001141 [Penicillium lagena]|uniref:uncharacterized protein n=1 Tax=Penicillium lagena TaxID=94218 RepID=UPI002541836B|nr:uncharacterized protein N7510_001141 [Penicillium lagena]KAJ5624832.1 hypothetical protein N7510_001141 [Penicillium lagena]